MDGAKAITDTLERNLVGRCPAWAEVCLRGYMDRVGIKILAIVRT